MKTLFPRTQRISRMVRFSLALFVGAACCSPRPARADGTLIPCPGRFDFTHDAARGLVYISSGAQVLRYRLSDGTFLSPIAVGGRAQGLDISPDGSTLAVADGAVFPNALGQNEPGGRIVLVNLDTLAQTNKTFALSFGESGAYSLAYDFLGNALISPDITVADPGFKRPLRRFFAANNYVGTIGEWGTSNPPQLVEARTVVSSDEAAAYLGFAETASLSGDWGTLSAREGVPTRFMGNPGGGTATSNPGLGGSNFDIAGSGTTWFLPTANDLQIRGGGGAFLSSIGLGYSDQGNNSMPCAVVTDTGRRLIYITRKQSRNIQVLDAGTWKPVASIDAEENVDFPNRPFDRGHLRLADNGTLLMESQRAGVRVFALRNGLPLPPTPANAISTAEDTPRPFVLPNPFGGGGSVVYSLISGPTRGWIGGDLPSATYTPYRNYNGADSFVYSVSDGNTTQTITVPITVTPVDDPFLASNLSARTRIGTSIGFWLSASDDDDYNQWNEGTGTRSTITDEIVTPPAHGTLVRDPLSTYGQAFIYTPEAGFEGTDTFTFRGVKGATGEKSSLGTGTITVSGAAPVARDDRFSIRVDPSFKYEYLYVAAPGILANDSSANNTLSVYNVTSASDGGRIWTGTDGALAYYPPDGGIIATNRVVTFQYRIWDGVVGSNMATATLDIKPYLFANALSYSGDEDTSFPVTLRGGGVAPLSFRVVTPPQNGTLSGTAPDLIYTPTANWSGSDSLTFQAVEADGSASNVNTVSLVVQPVNDAPVANDTNLATTEDVPAVWTPTGTDIEGSPLSFRVVTQPKNGDVAFNATTGRWTYTPAKDWNGSDSFTFVANDAPASGFYAGFGKDSAPATTTVSVAPANDAPVATLGNIATDEDTPLSFTLTGSDIDGDALFFSVVTPPQHGALSGTAPNLIFTPDANWNGTDSLRYRASDGQLSTEKLIYISAWAVNDAPIATPQTVSLDGVPNQAITLSGTDIDSTNLSFAVTTPPQHGTLSGVAPNLVYSPAAGYSGTDSFAFKANDGALDSAPATISLSIKPGNRAPVAQNGAITTNKRVMSTVPMVASDPDGNALLLSIVSGPQHGVLHPAVDDAGHVVSYDYEPQDNYTGADSFTFKANDGQLDSNIATVSITILPINYQPSALPQNLSLDEDTPRNITLGASDLDSTVFSFSIVIAPQNGTLSGTAPNLIYTPKANWSGGDYFSFKANDGALDSLPAKVELVVNPVNDAPVAQSQTVSLDARTTKSIALLASDIDSPSLSYSITTPPKNGTLSGVAPNLVYTPGASFSGTDSFAFKANDGALDSAPATVSLLVNAVNRAPISAPQSVSLDGNTSKTVTLTATDPDGDALSFEIVTAPTKGALSGSGANRTYTPNAGFAGSDSFTFRARDGALFSAPATVTLSVNAPNRAPVAQNGTLSLDEDTPKTLALGASDPDGNALSFAIVTPPAHGALSGTAPNLTYSPARDYNGSDSFSFQAGDGKLDSNTATVSIAVRAVNDAPLANGATMPIAFNKSTSFVLTGSDVEGNPLSFSISSGPSSGKMTGSNMNRNYTPNPGFIGTDSFTFRANDGALYSAVATITLVVSPQVPSAQAVAVSVLENASVSISLSGTAYSGASIDNWEIVSVPTNGTLSGTGNARLYTPTRFYAGADSFTFRVRDTRGVWSAPVLVSITVLPVNQAPGFSMANPNVALAKGAPTQTTANFATNISAGPPNESRQTLAFVLSNSNPALFSGQVALASNGTLSFTPKSGVTGTATVQVQLRDSGGTANGGQDTSPVQTFSIRVG